MKYLAIAAASLWAVLSGAAVHAGNPVVVELFTSQGCSSCPPADKVLGEIADDDDVIAIALHVDYWDYLGWKDAFANPDHTKRQRAYARAKGERTIYTPQMVVNGEDHVIGSKPMKLAKILAKHSKSRHPVAVKMTRDGDIVRISAKGKVPGSAVVQVLTYTPEQSVKIRRGENAGRTITYHHVVNKLAVIDTWNGSSEYATTVRVAAGTPVVVLVQSRDAGPILGAAQLR